MTKQKLFRHKIDEGTIPTCPLCRGSNAEFWSFNDGVPNFQGWCPACTNMRITRSAIDLIRQREKAHLLSAFLRDLPERDWQDIEDIVDANVERLADSVSEIPLVEQFDRLVFVLCERTPRFGSVSAFSYETDWPVIRARDATEVLAMLRALKVDGYLVADGKDGLFVPPTPTRKAFERYSELRNAGPMSQQAFVAMAFAPEFDSAWHSIIKPGIIAAGYRPFRVDQKEHAEKVDDLIMAEIRRSKFLVSGLLRPAGWRLLRSRICARPWAPGDLDVPSRRKGKTTLRYSPVQPHTVPRSSRRSEAVTKPYRCDPR